MNDQTFPYIDTRFRVGGIGQCWCPWVWCPWVDDHQDQTSIIHRFLRRRDPECPVHGRPNTTGLDPFTAAVHIAALRGMFGEQQQRLAHEWREGRYDRPSTPAAAPNARISAVMSTHHPA